MSPVTQLLTIARADLCLGCCAVHFMYKPFSESLGLRSKVLQKIEELRKTTSSASVPDEFLCPITRELMKDPVIATGMSPHDVD